MDSLNVAIQNKSGSKKKNVKYGCSDKENLKPSLLICSNKSKKKLNKVAFLSGLSRFDVKKNNTLGPGQNNNYCYYILLYKIIFLNYIMNKLNLY